MFLGRTDGGNVSATTATVSTFSVFRPGVEPTTRSCPCTKGNRVCTCTYVFVLAALAD